MIPRLRDPELEFRFHDDTKRLHVDVFLGLRERFMFSNQLIGKNLSGRWHRTNERAVSLDLELSSHAS